MKHLIASRRAACGSAIVVLLLVLQGCSTIRLVADYDEETDRAVTALQRKLETFFVALEDRIGTPEAAYEQNADFYREVRVDISAIRMRAGALPDNDLTLQQVDLLAENLDLLEEVHREGIGDVAVVQLIRDDFNMALTNILRLELAKRRGDGEGT
jgi:hypothetical protein